MTGTGRQNLAAGLLAAVYLLVGVVLSGCIPEPAAAADDPPHIPAALVVTAAGSDPHPTASPLPLPTPLPAATATPAPEPGEAAFVYGLAEYNTPSWTGVPRLHLLDVQGIIEQEPVSAHDLRLPAPAELMVPASPFLIRKGREERLLHLGVDYIVFGDPELVSPHPTAILAAAGYLIRGTYLPIAVDLSGETQLYLVTLEGPEGPAEVLICYTHLKDGSNASAIEQALANNGRVEVMGKVSPMGPHDPNPSDLHIAVIDVAALLSKTGQQDLSAALATLFSGAVERTAAQYPDLFLAPDSVLTALQDILPR